MQTFCLNKGLEIDQWYSDIGSALNYNRKNFLKLLEEVEQGKIKKIIIAHKDRLVRFGYEWIADFCKRHGTEIICMSNDSLSPEEEIVKDVLTILDVFSCRIYGLRKYKNEISKEIQGKKEKEEEKEEKKENIKK